MTEAALAVALQKAAATYLNRYVPSTHQFKEMLIRKCKKLALDLPQDVINQRISHEIDRRTKQGLLNDESYAATWADHMQRSGKSVPQIKAKLYRKRIPQSIIEQTIQAISNYENQSKSAILYAKRRRLGPYGPAEETDSKSQWKAIQKMVRAGHRYEIAKAIISGQINEETLDENR